MFFFFNDTATTEIYTLSLHDALPISPAPGSVRAAPRAAWPRAAASSAPTSTRSTTPHRARAASSTRLQVTRSEEHTSELQSQSNLVCRLLLEKKKKAVKQSLLTILTK